MAKVKQAPARNKVKTKDTWDLTKMFTSDAAREKAYQKLEVMVGEYAKFQRRLGESAAVLRECLDFDCALERLADQVGGYAHLKSTEDVANSDYQAMMQRFIFLATRAGEIASFITPEIQAIPRKKMEVFLKDKQLAPYRFNLEKLLRFKPHILTKKEERLLAMQGEVAQAPGQIFGQLNDADMSFGFVTNEEGVRVELTQSSSRALLESPKRSVRKKAFTQFYKEYEDHQNTLSSTLSASVLQDVYRSRARNFPSALEGALFGDKVPMTVYNNLIDTVHANLETLYRYFELRKKTLKLSRIHAYDTYVPLLKSKKVKIPYEQAVDTICEALEPLGVAYGKTLRKGLLDARWVDRYENKGKRSGAFSSGCFDSMPYILMNYKEDVIDSMFTLAHEAGHSMHSHYSHKVQPYQYSQYTIFVAEVASTFNEQLLGKYLYDRAKSKQERARLINKEIDDIRGTIIRQTMFAEFEKKIHTMAEAGQPLTIDTLRDEYKGLLSLYFGPKFSLDESLSLECLRIPHFYSAFYVYKYATGLSAAIALSQSVLHGGTKERARYLNFLKTGGSQYPLDQLRAAGVDLEQPEPVDQAMARFRELVEELETLL